MNLTEIEAVTDALLEKLASTESAAEVRDLCFRIDGMYRGAQIKAIVQAVPKQVPICESRSRSGDERCVLPAGHVERHRTGDAAPLSWPNGEDRSIRNLEEL